MFYFSFPFLLLTGNTFLRKVFFFLNGMVTDATKAFFIKPFCVFLKAEKHKKEIA